MDEGELLKVNEKEKPSKVVLVWKREQYEDGMCTASDSFTIDNAALSTRNGACYLTYEESISDGAGAGATEVTEGTGELVGAGGADYQAGNLNRVRSEAGTKSDERNHVGNETGVQNHVRNGNDQSIRTTLRISQSELTLIRHGAVRWNHTFRPGKKTSSTMYVGGAVLAIESVTKSLAVNVTDYSGEVFLVYDINLSGMAQTVKLWIRFGEHDGESTEETKYN
jgi:uncharacterized beta-barrel protein YwiB (DUF1934 family)